MPRLPLAYESRITIDGRVLAPGALYWSQREPLPLLVSMNEDGHAGAFPIGTVTDVERGIDQHRGAIFATLSHPIRGMAPEIDLDLPEYEEGPYGLLIITRARLRAVTLGLRPTWDGLVIQ